NGGLEWAVPGGDALEGAKVGARPDLDALRASARPRSDEQRIEHDELANAEGRALIGGLRVVLVRMSRAHDLDDQSGNGMSRLPETQARKLSRARRGRLHQAQIGVETHGGAVLAHAYGKIAEHGGVTPRAGHPVLE